MIEIILHKATAADMAWVNAIYREIKFLPSDYSNEYIVIACVGEEKVGLGRLITIGNVLELGGMYVAEEWRGKKIANSIVAHLMAQVPKGQLVYCIPFAHLEHFYKSFGFIDAEITDEIPQEIKQKIGYCSQTYSTKTLLLQMIMS